MKMNLTRPKALTNELFHYCPGCSHGIIHRIVAQAIDELNMRENTIGVASVGCSVLAYNYFNVDMQQAAHGRAPAVATGIKRVLPDRMVFTYQGDGDLASIGCGEIVHAAARGENITVIFVNNTCYGMTGGQMAPTTLLGQPTTTTPGGRTASRAGYPLRVAEMLAVLEGPAFIARTSVHNPKAVLETQKAVIRAFKYQTQGLGFSMVEILSACPTNWRMKPGDALKWIKDNMLNYYPVGVFKTPAYEEV